MAEFWGRKFNTHLHGLYALDDMRHVGEPSHYLIDPSDKSMLETSGDETRLHAVWVPAEASDSYIPG